ncbi:MAG: KTSC domain-containing protein [Hyphomicrobiaceae bacterium]|nr:MAG: KTSC domain-containing protein [Hyphomicrobiaceae bacterium]
MEMKRVYSSHIDKIGYNPASQEFHVEYQKGKTSIYRGVSPDDAKSVLEAASVGSALKSFRGKYEHGYKDD